MTVTCGATLCGTRLTKLLPSRPAPTVAAPLTIACSPCGAAARRLRSGRR
jgi:hypothetical protein